MKDPDICDSSSVGHRMDLIVKGAMYPDVSHAGFISHCCGLKKGHDGDCVCKCGTYWTKHHGT